MVNYWPYAIKNYFNLQMKDLYFIASLLFLVSGRFGLKCFMNMGGFRIHLSAKSRSPCLLACVVDFSYA